jgi:hypothetical protein
MSYVAGASASIIKTLKEIEAIFGGERLSPAGPKRKKLRTKLLATLIKSSKAWYRKGFKRGHMESFRHFQQKSRVPFKLVFEANREFVPNTRNTVKLKSTLSKAFRQSVTHQ